MKKVIRNFESLYFCELLIQVLRYIIHLHSAHKNYYGIGNNSPEYGIGAKTNINKKKAKQQPMSVFELFY